MIKKHVIYNIKIYYNIIYVIYFVYKKIFGTLKKYNNCTKLTKYKQKQLRKHLHSKKRFN